MRSVSAPGLLALFLALTLVAAAVPAQAGGYRHHGWHHGHGKHYGHGHYNRHHHAYRHHRHHRSHYGRGRSDIVLGAGIIGGAVIVGSVLSQPRYVAPPPPPTVYYVTPPRQPTCVQDQVYRYLPDGSIQWGTRTRCY